MSLDGKVIYYVLTGARKARMAAQNVRELCADGAGVYVILTPSAEEIVERDELIKASGRVVRSSFRKTSPHDSLPLEDLVVVAPATYNTVNKVARGIADNFALACVAAAIGRGTPVLMAPAMNFDLWSSPIVQESIRLLRSYGVRIIHPALDTEARTCTMADAGKVLDAIYHELARIRYRARRLEDPCLEALYVNLIQRLGPEICRIGCELEAQKLTSGTAGCISVRTERGFLVTASGAQVGSLQPDDLTLVLEADERENSVLWYGRRPPSSETPLHAVIYNEQPHVHAVIHTHCPSITYSPRLRDFRTSEYIRYGTFAFGRALVEQMNRNGIPFAIAKDHGDVVAGADLADALSRLEGMRRVAAGEQIPLAAIR